MSLLFNDDNEVRLLSANQLIQNGDVQKAIGILIELISGGMSAASEKLIALCGDSVITWDSLIPELKKHNDEGNPELLYVLGKALIASSSDSSQKQEGIRLLDKASTFGHNEAKELLEKVRSENRQVENEMLSVLIQGIYKSVNRQSALFNALYQREKISPSLYTWLAIEESLQDESSFESMPCTPDDLLRIAVQKGDAEALGILGTVMFDHAQTQRTKWLGYYYLKKAEEMGDKCSSAKLVEIGKAETPYGPFAHDRVFHDHDLITAGLVLSHKMEIERQIYEFIFRMEDTMEDDNYVSKIVISYGEMAAALGSMVAAKNIGVCYLRGKHVKKDQRRAWIWLSWAAKLGDHDATLYMDKERSEYGSSVVDQEMLWALCGYPPVFTAFFGEARMYRDPMGAYLGPLEAAMEGKDKVALCLSALAFLQKHLREKGLPMMQEAADLGNSEAWIALGEDAESEEGGSDYVKAEKCYREAVALGDASGLFRLACLYYNHKRQDNGKQIALEFLNMKIDTTQYPRNSRSYTNPTNESKDNNSINAMFCLKKLEEDPTLKEKYGDLALEDLIKVFKTAYT
ncbi:MAG: sel1 repeat family protein [Prevotella sp.]|nr:sel1 repeat family protein [Prevotella sp.]